MQPELVRGYVQRVRVGRLGGRAVALFEIRIPGETVHLVCAAGAGVGVLDEPGRAALRAAMRASHALADGAERAHLTQAAHATNVASGANALWRARFEGASVTHTTFRAIDFARDGKTVRADCGDGRRDDDLRILDNTLENTTAEGDEPTRRALEEQGAAIAASLSTLDRVGRRDAIARALRKATAKVDRRVAAIMGDLSRIDGADALAARAQLFVAVASNAPRGTRQLRAIDWSSGQATVVELTIDPARSAGEQMNSLFKRARRLKEGRRVADARLEEARTALAGLEGALAELASDQADLDALEARGRAAAPRDFKLAASGVRGSSTSGAREHAARPPYRTFVGASQARILVGRGAAHNDALTLQVARPHDLWLHARGTAGAHVVVPLLKGKSCPPDWLVEAAHLAVHFSDARDEPLVDVVYTPRRYLRKPRGSAPGLVIVDREKVFVLRRDDQILKRLLEAEIV